MSSKSASLEELVKANKAQFDRIFSTQMGTLDVQPGVTAEPSETPVSVADEGQASLDSGIRKILTERYGDGWSHEIVEHSIDGDEVRVVCRLEADGLTSTQHGSARNSGNVGIALRRYLLMFGYLFSLAVLGKPPAHDFRVCLIVVAAIGVGGDQRAVLELHRWAEAAALVSGSGLVVDQQAVGAEVEGESVLVLGPDQCPDSQRRVQRSLGVGVEQTAVM